MRLPSPSREGGMSFNPIAPPSGRGDAAAPRGPAQKPRKKNISYEQKVRFVALGALCTAPLAFFIAGCVYYRRAEESPLQATIDTARVLLTTALGLSICMFCLGLGYYNSILHDTSYLRLKPGREAPQQGGAQEKQAPRHARSKAFALAAVVFPALLLIAAGALSATVPSEVYPRQSVVPACDGQGPLPTDAVGRECTYWRGQAPEKQLYMQECAHFRALSCCSREEAEHVTATTRDWMDESLSGDRYSGGTCRDLFAMMSCWVCSPDQAQFYREGKLTVCARMCNTLYDVCQNTVFDHGERTFSDMFGSGTELCAHFGYSVASCGCYEAYPDQDYTSYASATLP